LRRIIETTLLWTTTTPQQPPEWSLMDTMLVGYHRIHRSDDTRLPVELDRITHPFLDLSAERYALCEEYYKFNDDVKSVEVLRRGAENIMSADAPERTRKRTQDISL